MKKYFIAIFLFPFLTMLAQSYNQVGAISKFGLAGGVTPMIIYPDLSPINSKLKAAGLGKIDNSGIFTWGGGGYVYVLFVKDLRIGGMGFSGSSDTKRTINGIEKEAIYSIGGGAFTIEYTIPQVKIFALSVGAMLGVGELDVEYFENSSAITWDGFWNNSGNNKKNSYGKLSGSYWIVSPTLNIDYPVNRFMAFRIGCGYQFSLGTDWKYNNEKGINEMPDDLNGNGFFLQAGFFLGFFAF